MPKDFFQEEEANRILQLAAQRGAGRISRDELLRAAQELGITEDALAEAELQYRSEQEDQLLKQQYRKFMLGRLYRSISFFLVCLAVAIVLTIATEGSTAWLFIPVAIWAALLLQMGASTYAALGPDEESRFQKWKRWRFPLPPSPPPPPPLF